MSIVSCYVGLDYHDETIRVCVLAEDGELIVNRNVGNDPAEVRRLVQLRGASVCGVAIEACCGSADFAAELIAQTGWSVKLAHPAAVQRLKKNRDKTDHGDAWLLADLLRELSPGSVAGGQSHTPTASSGATSSRVGGRTQEHQAADSVAVARRTNAPMLGRQCVDQAVDGLDCHAPLGP